MFEFEHSAGATLDYGFNWSVNGWLEASETITTSVWTENQDITLSREQIYFGVTSVFVTGGTAGTVYKLMNTITTSTGRIDSRTITLTCKQR